ncbi:MULTISPECIES: hypothetical protein [Natrialbaceae]|nr:hypothetical protein [Natronococcus sp. CG52]
MEQPPGRRPTGRIERRPPRTDRSLERRRVAPFDDASSSVRPEVSGR